MTDLAIPGCPACGKPGAIEASVLGAFVRWKAHEEWCPLADARSLWRDTEAQAIAAATLPTCRWSLDEIDGIWSGSCGIVWEFSNGGGTEENEVVYCPRCGRKVAEE